LLHPAVEVVRRRGNTTGYYVRMCGMKLIGIGGLYYMGWLEKEVIPLRCANECDKFKDLNVVFSKEEGGDVRLRLQT
jgi:hypothetical protein